MCNILKYQITTVLFISLLISSESIGQNSKRHSFEIGPEVYYFGYSEYRELVLFGIPSGIDETVMEEDGIFYGVTGAYTFRGWKTNEGGLWSERGLMLRTEGRFASGKVDYDGSLQDGSPLTITDIDNHTMEFRGLIGLGNSNFDSSLYTGFGYRYLNDDLSKFSGGYERESNYYYIPVGLTFDGMENADGWSAGLTFEFDFLLRGLQKTHLSDTGLGFSDFENKQKKGWGLRASMKFIRHGEIDFILEPFARLWVIDDSEVEIIEGGIPVYEPKNETLEGGINIVIRF